MIWTEEEYAALRLYVNEKMATKVAYKEFSETGYERSLGAFTKKYRLALQEVEKADEVATVYLANNTKSEGPDMIVVVALIIGAMIVGYWWSLQ